MSYTFVIQQDVFIFIMTNCCNNYVYYCLLFYTKKDYILGFNPKHSSITTPAVSSFIFPMTSLFEYSCYLGVVK